MTLIDNLSGPGNYFSRQEYKPAGTWETNPEGRNITLSWTWATDSGGRNINLPEPWKLMLEQENKLVGTWESDSGGRTRTLSRQAL